MRFVVGILGLMPALSFDAGAETSPPAPFAVVVYSIDWRNLTNVPVGEGSLVAMTLDARRGHERVAVTDPDYVKQVADLSARLVPASVSEPADDFRILVQLVWRDGATSRVAVPRSCHVMTRDGRAVAFDQDLYRLLVSRLSDGHRLALGGACTLR
jgi:hypothetical protein